MGERIALGVVAVILACGLSSAAAPVQAVTVQAAPVASAEWQPTYDIDPGLADKFVAETPRGAPDELKTHWVGCGVTVNVNYAVGPGVDASRLRDQLAYPVRYLQDLGYSAAIGVEVPYAPGLPVPPTVGDVLVVAEVSPEHLTTNEWLASTTYGYSGLTIMSARVEVDAARGMSSDVLLHEFGHVLGLPHKKGSVMDIPNNNPVWFDAAETAAIDCRTPATAAR